MRAWSLGGLFGCVVSFVSASACQDDTKNVGLATVPAATEPPPPPAIGDVTPTPSAQGDRPSPFGPPEPAPPPYVPFDVNHVLSTGQSNSVANDGVPILSRSQPYANLMFDTGVMTGGGCDTNGCTTYQKPSGFLPLVEGDTFFYPVETMSSGLANLVAAMARERNESMLHVDGEPHAVLVSLHGRSGNSYGCLRKGSCDWWQSKSYVQPFDEAMRQVRDGKALAAASGKTYAVRAVTAIHGEHDHYAYSDGHSAFPMPGTDGTSTVRDYSDALLEWQRDYENEVKAITAQTVEVPLLINQYSHWNDVPTTKIAYMQLDAHLRAPGKVVVIGPTYALEYTSKCLHFSNHGERHLGEYFAKAYAAIVLERRAWEPLRPIAVTLQGNVVTAKFHVPVPPLVLDTTRVDDPGQYGFEWYDGSGAPPAITNVAITGPDVVSITLASAPTGADRRLRYAYTFHGCAGPRSVPRGNLRDSDATQSPNGYDLFNWAVHFDQPVP